MARQITEYRVFIASPGGLEDFRAQFAEILNRYNQHEALPRGVTFTPVGWEDVVATVGRPQAAINEELRSCDYVVFLFRDRWGSPPNGDGRYTSGSEEEWAVAQEEKTKGQIKDIALYFFPVSPDKLNDTGPKLAPVLAFKDKVIKERNCLFKELKKDEEFPDQLRGNLAKWLKTHDASNSPPDPQTKPDLTPVPESSENPFGHLLNRAYELVEEGRFDAGLAFVDECAKSASDPVVHSRSLLLKSYCSYILNRPEDSVAACEELIATYAMTTNNDPSIREQIVLAYYNKAIALGTLNRPNEELDAYNQIISKYAGDTQPAIYERIADALINQGVTLGQLGYRDEALRTYNKIITTYNKDTKSSIREKVANALVNKAITLESLNRHEEALDAYNQVVKIYGKDDERNIHQHIARALFNMGMRLADMNRTDEALSIYNQVITNYENDTEPAICEEVVRALINKGVTLSRLNKSHEAIDVYNKVIKSYSDYTVPGIREQVAKALINKGVTLSTLNKFDEAIDVYNKVIKIYSDYTAPGIREQVAMAHFNVGVRFDAMKLHNDALDAFSRVINIYGEDTERAVRKLVAMALINKGFILSNLCNYDDARTAFQQVVDQYSDDQALQEIVANARTNLTQIKHR